MSKQHAITFGDNRKLTTGLVTGELVLLVEVRSETMGRNDNSWDVQWIGVLNPDNHSEKIEKKQSKWIYLKGKNLGWLNKLLQKDASRLTEFSNEMDVEWFDQQSSPAIGYMEYGLSCTQKRISFRQLKKLNTCFSLISCFDGTDFIKNCSVVGKNVMQGDKIIISKANWNKQDPFFYIPE